MKTKEKLLVAEKHQEIISSSVALLEFRLDSVAAYFFLKSWFKVIIGGGALNFIENQSVMN